MPPPSTASRPQPAPAGLRACRRPAVSQEARLAAGPRLRLGLLGPRLVAVGPGRHGDLLGLDLDAGPHPLHAVDDYPVARLEAGARREDAQVAVGPAGRDRAVLDLVLAVDDQHVLFALVGADGRVGHE